MTEEVKKYLLALLKRREKEIKEEKGYLTKEEKALKARMNKLKENDLEFKMIADSVDFLTIAPEPVSEPKPEVEASVEEVPMEAPEAPVEEAPEEPAEEEPTEEEAPVEAEASIETPAPAPAEFGKPPKHKL